MLNYDQHLRITWQAQFKPFFFEEQQPMLVGQRGCSRIVGSIPICSIHEEGKIQEAPDSKIGLGAY